MFLSTEPGNFGGAIAKSGLDKDFEKLCNYAGYRNHQSCFSMFRHRFITDLVLMHLRAWDEQKGEMNKRDYRTMLEKVREKTGHKTTDPLWYYIDLARDMVGVWDPVNKAVSRLHAAEELKYELSQLKRDLRLGQLNHMASTQVIDFVTARLGQIIGDAEQSGISDTSSE